MDNSGYLLIKDGIVINAIYASEEFANEYASDNGMIAINPGALRAGIGHKYHDGKFWRDVHDIILCDGGMVHDGETDPCAGGEVIGQSEESHEEEIT
jgi:hypothetical protein